MTPHPTTVIANGILKELADNLAIDLVVPEGRRQHLETCVQLITAQFPHATAKGIYYMPEHIYQTAPGAELHGLLERIGAASQARAMKEYMQ